MISVSQLMISDEKDRGDDEEEMKDDIKSDNRDRVT